MSTDRDVDSREFGKKAETIRNFPDENGLMLPFSSVKESPSVCGFNQSDINLASSNKVHENDYDFASKSSRSGPEFRFINPAIYAESFEADEDYGDDVEKSIVRGENHSRRIDDVDDDDDDDDDDSSETGMEAKCRKTALMDQFSILSISNVEDSASRVVVDGDHAPGTYRCLPSITSHTTTSSMKSYNQPARPLTRLERRCKLSDDFQASGESISSEDLCFMSTQQDERKIVQRCSLNGHRIMQGSTTSFSTTNLSERQTLSGVPIARQIGHAEWVREKEREALKVKEERLFEQKRKAKEERIRRETEERERQERESFLRWAERKRKEETARKAAIERELEIQRRLEAIEDKAAIAKAIYLRQWARKKEEEQKAYQKKHQLKQLQEAEEKRKRLEDSVKAYEKWREKSKDKPKPATQAHQKAKPAYVNPEPWQQIIEDEPELVEPIKEPLKEPTDRTSTPKLGNDKIKATKTRSSHR